jgi:hypothetical protein
MWNIVIGVKFSCSFLAKTSSCHSAFFYHMLSTIALNPMHYHDGIAYPKFDESIVCALFGPNPQVFSPLSSPTYYPLLH